MADTLPPKNITAHTSEAAAGDSTPDWSGKWRELKQSKDFKTWANDRAGNKTVQGRKDLVEALVKYVEAAGGIVISVPGARLIRVEIPQGSDLPARLAELGWQPIQCTATTRVTGRGIEPVDVIEITLGITGSHGIPTFEGKLAGSGNLVLNPHSIGYIEVGGNTEVLVNTTSSAEIVTASDTHAANMEIVLTGIHLGLTKNDFHLV